MTIGPPQRYPRGSPWLACVRQSSARVPGSTYPEYGVITSVSLDAFSARMGSFSARLRDWDLSLTIGGGRNATRPAQVSRQRALVCMTRSRGNLCYRQLSGLEQRQGSSQTDIHQVAVGCGLQAHLKELMETACAETGNAREIRGLDGLVIEAVDECLGPGERLDRTVGGPGVGAQRFQKQW